MDSPPHLVGVYISGGSAPPEPTAKTSCWHIGMGPAQPRSGTASPSGGRREDAALPEAGRRAEGMLLAAGLGLSPASFGSLLCLSLTLSPGAHFSTWASSKISATLVVVVVRLK